MDVDYLAPRGLIKMLQAQEVVQHPVAALALVLVLTVVTAYVFFFSGPRLDPNEPPLIRPRIPYVGHLFSLAIWRVGYFQHLHERTNYPIATLPILNGKMYVIFSTQLQQSAMCSKTMNPMAFTTQFIPRLFGIQQETLATLLGWDGVHESAGPWMTHIFQNTLSGEHLNELTLSTMTYLGSTLNAIGDRGIHVPNLYMWIRDTMSLATSSGLFGHEHNPYAKDQAVVDAQWDFDTHMATLLPGILPSVLARSAHLARKKVWAALEPYYRARHDESPGASAFVRDRGRLFRSYALSDRELSRNELSVMLAATSNTVPILFWYVSHIFLRPALLADLRAEVAAALGLQGGAATPGRGGAVTVHFGVLEARCPLLVACFRESVRLSSQIILFRLAAEDTVVSDGGGASFLLRAGTTVMMPAGVVHQHKGTWGEDAEEFEPRRWVDAAADRKTEKLRRGAYVPFGGGRHRCPGRRFVLLENLAFVAALVMGFEVRGLDAERIKMADSGLGEATKPVRGWEGGPVSIVRREGWENVEWKYEP